MRFKVEFYFHVLHTLIQRLETRFEDFRHVAEFFSIPNPKKFPAGDTTTRIRALAKFYAGDVESDSEWGLDEFLSFCAVCSELKIKLKSTEAILPFMICNDMDRAFPNIAILYCIYLTLPVSSANVERSFSCLKLIKNYLRACMEEARLSNLTLRRILSLIMTRWLRGL